MLRGTRFPADAHVDNVDAFMEIEGLSLEEAIAATLDCSPETSGGADTMVALLAFASDHC